MIEWIVATAATGAFVASGIPQRLYHKYHNKISDFVFSAKSAWVGTRSTLGLVNSIDKLKFEKEKICRAIEKLRLTIIDLETIKRKTVLELDILKRAFDSINDDEDKLQLQSTIDEVNSTYEIINNKLIYAKDQINTYKDIYDNIEDDLDHASTSKQLLENRNKFNVDIINDHRNSLKRDILREYGDGYK